MSIDDGAVNALYEVTELHVKDENMRRLEALVITEGKKIRILNRKRNGACIIKVMGRGTADRPRHMDQRTGELGINGKRTDSGVCGQSKLWKNDAF